jgi:5-methylcytosine-specific restriction endonuclease McrA
MTLRNFDDPAYKKWRKDVYIRDKFKCQWPNCTSKKKLNAHHIMPWAHNIGLRFDINNGITLCYNHHKLIRGQEDIYACNFLKILADKKNDKTR